MSLDYCDKTYENRLLANGRPQQVKAILFDCDNTLVMSESRAFEACADLSNEVLEKKGVKDRYTAHDLHVEFVGQNFRGMLNSMKNKYGFDMSEDELHSWVEQELQAVTNKLKQGCDACDGVEPVLEKYKKSGQYEMAIVSTSALPRVVASIETANLDQYFDKHKIYSAASSMEKPSSKPNPDIYFFSCDKLGVKPSESVAIEDSKSGATAAKNAKIPLIGYLGPYKDEGQEKVDQMAKVLKEDCGAAVLMHHWREFDDCLAKVQAM